MAANTFFTYCKLVPSVKTNSFSEDFTIAPNVIMSSSVFSDIKPKILKKEKDIKINVNYWIWKNNDKVIQIVFGGGIYFTDENYNADKIINAFPTLRKRISTIKAKYFMFTQI